jgi:hypothetical protein
MAHASGSIWHGRPQDLRRPGSYRMGRSGALSCPGPAGSRATGTEVQGCCINRVGAGQSAGSQAAGEERRVVITMTRRAMSARAGWGTASAPRTQSGRECFAGRSRRRLEREEPSATWPVRRVTERMPDITPRLSTPDEARDSGPLAQRLHGHHSIPTKYCPRRRQWLIAPRLTRAHSRVRAQ